MKLRKSVLQLAIVITGTLNLIGACFPPCPINSYCLRGRCISRARNQRRRQMANPRASMSDTMSALAASIFASNVNVPPIAVRRDADQSEEDDSQGSSRDHSRNSDLALHDHVRDSGKHFSFESAWLVPWMPVRNPMLPIPPPITNQAQDDDEESSESSDVVPSRDEFINPPSSSDTLSLLEELLSPAPAHPETEISPYDDVIDDLDSDEPVSADDSQDTDDTEENTSELIDDMLEESQSQVVGTPDEITDDNPLDEIEETSDDSTQDDAGDDDDDNDDDGDDKDLTDDTEIVDLESAEPDVLIDEFAPEIEHTDDAHAHANPQEILDTWTDDDTENMKAYGFNIGTVRPTTRPPPTSPYVPRVTLVNRKNMMGGFSGGDALVNDDNDSEDRDDRSGPSNSYALASIPVAVAIVVVGVIFLYCKYRRMKKRETERSNPQGQQNRSQPSDDDRKVSASSTTGLINHTRVSVSSMGSAECAPNIYVDISDIDPRRHRKMSVAGKPCNLNPITANPSNLGPIQEQFDLKTFNTMATNMKDMTLFVTNGEPPRTPPPSYDEAVYTEFA